MGLFGNITSKSLQVKVEKATASFRKAITDLTEVNEEAALVKSEKEKEIKEAQTEISAIDSLTEQNNKMITKLQSIIE